MAVGSNKGPSQHTCSQHPGRACHPGEYENIFRIELHGPGVEKLPEWVTREDNIYRNTHLFSEPTGSGFVHRWKELSLGTEAFVFPQ